MSKRTIGLTIDKMEKASQEACKPSKEEKKAKTSKEDK